LNMGQSHPYTTDPKANLSFTHQPISDLEDQD